MVRRREVDDVDYDPADQPAHRCALCGYGRFDECRDPNCHTATEEHDNEEPEEG